jgi:predicted lipoprotein with Yx(FWY)xxD motif
LNQTRRGGVKLGMSRSHGPQRSWQRLGLRLVGSGLLFATGGIHLDLYLTGYRTIPTIGWMFLLQVIGAFVLAAIVLVFGSRLAAAAGALLALSTLGGYLLSVWVGLFGDKEVRTTAGIVAGVIEVAAFAALGAFALWSAPVRAHAAQPSPAMDQLRRRLPVLMTGLAGVSVIALVLLGVAMAGSGPASAPPAASSGQASASGGQVFKTMQIKGATVLTNTKGMTLYWFAPDTPTKSVCYGSCAQYWPPVYGSWKAGSGVTGQIGTIKRSDGTTQATYDGHPLYTYIADSKPGQATGNNINLNGGLWHEVLASAG